MKKAGKILGQLMLWLIGAAFLVIYLYTDLIFDNYKISFASHMYMVDPWSTQGAEFKGPRFTDIEDSEYPALYSVFKDGDGFEQWNNKVALGTTSSYSYVMYPLNYIYKLPMDQAVLIKVCVEFMLAFISIYLLMREYKCGKIASAITGVTYMFSATMVVWLGWTHSDVAAFAPFAFLFAEKLIDKVKLRYALHLAVVIFLMYIAGMPTFAAYFTYLLGFYVLFKTIKKQWGHVFENIKTIIVTYVYFGIGILMGVGLTLPYTISLVQSVGGNGYADSRANQSSARLGIEYLRTLIYPYFRQGLKLHINETTLYCGILAVLLLPMTFFNFKKKKQACFYGISTLIIFILIFTPGLDVIYTRLPMINSSLKYRIITLLMFTMSVLMGINLNDIFENREYYRHKLYSIAVLFGWAVIVISAASSKLVTLKDGKVSNTMYEEYTDYSTYYSKAMWLMIILVGMLTIYILRESRIIAFLMCIVVIWDGTGFAREYLPLIDKDHSVIPKATNTISYLQKNTEDNSRIVVKGSWTLMANATEYYGLNDVSMHDFVATNQDIVKYYKKICKTCFASPTRAEFAEITNYDLLRYLGVKYIVGTSLISEYNYSSEYDEFETTDLIPADATVIQEFETDQKNLHAIDVLVGTNNTEYEGYGWINATVVDEKNGNVVGKSSVAYSNIENDSYIEFFFNDVELRKGDKYMLIISTPKHFNEELVFYKTVNDEDDNELYVQDENVDGHLIMKQQYFDTGIESVYDGEDHLLVGEFTEYAPKAFLAEKVYTGSDKEILDTMSEDYVKNEAFINEDDADSSVSTEKLSKDEVVRVDEYDDDYVKLTYSSDEKRYLVLTDYYDKNWKAYVNGKETDIVKANYLMRGIVVEPGENVTVEFKYEPETTNLMVKVSEADFALLVILSISNFIYCIVKRKKSLDN